MNCILRNILLTFLSQRILLVSKQIYISTVFLFGILKFVILLCYCTQLYVTFKNSPTYFGNVLVPVGNTELSHKMASYTTDQKVFVTKPLSHSSGDPYIATDVQYRREFSLRVAPLRDTIHLTVKQF